MSTPKPLPWGRGAVADYIATAVAAGVSSVFGRTGAVTAQAGDYTATQVTVTPAGGIVATNVQAALVGLDTGTVKTFNGRTGTVVPASGDYTAAQTTFTPTGSITATDVQNAIAQVASSSWLKAQIRAMIGAGTFIAGTVTRFDGGTALTVANTGTPSATQIGFTKVGTGQWRIIDGSTGLFGPAGSTLRKLDASFLAPLAMSTKDSGWTDPGVGYAAEFWTFNGGANVDWGFTQLVLNIYSTQV